MKILLLCGSLEAGLDGVGDYTRRLACNLIEQGNQVTAIALYDKFVKDKVKTTQYLEGMALPVLRISSTLSETSRFSAIHEWMVENGPEWISLQYVPFAYNNKGIPWKLGASLKKVSPAGCFWHIMFHELWIGHANKIYQLDYWKGLMQNLAIQKIYKLLKPSLITTHAFYYQFLLEEQNIKPHILPLFGNLSINTNPAVSIWEKLGYTNLESFNYFQTGVVFGSIPAKWNIEKILKSWNSFLESEDKSGLILFMGNHKRNITDLITYILENFPRIKVLELGVLSEDEISQVLLKSDFGITPTPLVLIEKSGTVAAMIEHGLTIICSRFGNVKKSFNFKNRNLLVHLADSIDEEFFRSLKKSEPSSKVSEISEQLVKLMNKVKD